MSYFLTIAPPSIEVHHPIFDGIGSDCVGSGSIDSGWVGSASVGSGSAELLGCTEPSGSWGCFEIILHDENIHIAANKMIAK
jgi:hypothetical protein